METMTASRMLGSFRFNGIGERLSENPGYMHQGVVPPEGPISGFDVDDAGGDGVPRHHTRQPGLEHPRHELKALASRSFFGGSGSDFRRSRLSMLSPARRRAR